MSAGTHGSIKAYIYPTNKLFLQHAVEEVIATNKQIQLDTAKNYSISMDNGRSDTIYDNYYNDRVTYVSFSIKVNGGVNRYTIRYGGGQEDWDTAKTSSVFIAYAWDKNNKGGSEGNGGVSWYHWGLKRRLIKPFESELIFRVDSILKMRHTNSE